MSPFWFSDLMINFSFTPTARIPLVNQCMCFQFVNSASGETQADGRGASDQQSACGERQGDCKTRLTSLITQTRISTQDVPPSINTQETHI